MCNTAVERAALDPGSRRHADAYLDRLTRGFRRALDNAVAAGEVEATPAQLDALADFFTMSLIGVSASIQAEMPAEQVHAACTVATSTLDRYQPAS